MLMEVALALASGVSPQLELPGQKPAQREFGKLYELAPQTRRAPPANRVCSIPLVQTLPPEKPAPRMKIVPPDRRVRMHMRAVTPPAPPCEKR